MEDYYKIVEILNQSEDLALTDEIDSIILNNIKNNDKDESIRLVLYVYCFLFSLPYDSNFKIKLRNYFDKLFEANFNWNTILYSKLILSHNDTKYIKPTLDDFISLSYSSFKKSFFDDYLKSDDEGKNNLLNFLSKVFLRNNVFTDEDSIKIWDNFGFHEENKRNNFLLKIKSLEQFEKISKLFKVNLYDIVKINSKPTFIGTSIIRNLRQDSNYQKELAKKNFTSIFNCLKNHLENMNDIKLKNELLNNLVVNSSSFFNKNEDICFSSDFKSLDLTSKVNDSDEKDKELGVLMLKSKNLLKFHKYNKNNKYNYSYDPFLLFSIIPKKFHLITLQKSFTLELLKFQNLDFIKILENYSNSKKIDFYFPLRPKAYLKKEESFDYFSFSTLYKDSGTDYVTFTSLSNLFDLLGELKYTLDKNIIFMLLNKSIFSNTLYLESFYDQKLESIYERFSILEKKEIILKIFEVDNFISNFDSNCLEYHNKCINGESLGFKKRSCCFSILNKLLDISLKDNVYFNINEKLITKINNYGSYFNEANDLSKKLSFISLKTETKNNNSKEKVKYKI